ncbi:MAG TPA: hypothetical protein VHS56_13775, partial [Candidatus Cybelea sp.]|nr:hypothetical protein [Candidatus Cybelea sp.]
MRALVLLVAALLASYPEAVAPSGGAPSGTTKPRAMVATAQRLATQVGVEVLRGGGNAVDAAVAVGYA